jgi:hypothetical protein
MPTLTLSPKQFLNPTRIEGIANEQMETNLQFANMFPMVGQTETAVAYMEDLVTAGDDYDAGTTGKPLDLGELSELTEVEISQVTQKAGMLKPFGFKIAVSERDINRGSVVDELSRAVFRGAYIMARRIDDDIISKLQNSTNDVSEGAGAAVWSADGATVADDVISFQEAFDLDGYATELTDLFVHKTNFYEAKRYFADILMGVTGRANQPGNKDVIDTGLGTMLHRARSASIAEGSYLGVDARRGFEPITVHAYRNPQFAASRDFGLVNVYQYKEEKYPHRTITEFISEIFAAVKRPNSATYRASGI